MMFQGAPISDPNSQTNIPDNQSPLALSTQEETEATLVCSMEEEAGDALSWGAGEA